jgi:hypothetical protein
MKCTTKAALASYLRSVGIAVAAVYIALNGEVFDVEGLKVMLYAAVVAAAGPAVRALNPHDVAFGKLQAPDHLDEH